MAENPLKRKRDSKADSKNDEKLKQFLGVMQATAKTRIWQNDVTDGAGNTVTAVNEAGDSSDDDIQTLKSIKKGKPQSDQPASEDMEMEDVVELSPETAAAQAKARAQTDKDWLRSKAGVLLDDDDEESVRPHEKAALDSRSVRQIALDLREQRENQAIPALKTEKTNPISSVEQDHTETELMVGEEQPAEASDTIDKIKKHGRLYLRNLPFTATEEDLRQTFSDFGELEEVRLNNVPPNIPFMMKYLDRDILCFAHAVNLGE